MRVKDLIKQLQEVENKDKYIHLLGNNGNVFNESSDIIFRDAEVWDDSSESITLYLCSYPSTKLTNKPLTNIS